MSNDKQQMGQSIDAAESLSRCLRRMHDLIVTTDGAEPGISHQERKERLCRYRAMVLDGPDYLEPAHGQSPLLDRLFPYTHNEIHFNAARKVGRLARQSHIVFAPLYTERSQNDIDPAKGLNTGTAETLKWIRTNAIHAERDKRDFRGGKDHFFTYITELFDYSEPFLTPKRLLERKKEEIVKTLSDEARAKTKMLDEHVRNSGVSNRSTNVIEFFAKAERFENVHFRWVRHDRPYQTFTLTQENVITSDRDKLEDYRNIAVFLVEEPWFRSYFSGARSTHLPKSGDPFARNALQQLNHDIFAPVLGRFVHGSHYLVLPLKLFLRRPLEEDKEDTLLKNLSKLSDDPTVFEQSADWIANPCVYDGLRDVAFDRALEKIREKERLAKSGELDRLIASVTRDFLKLCFRNDILLEDSYVAFKCMGGRAFVFSNVGCGFATPDSDPDALFSRTVIIDCGMNGFERGRLIQNLTEFETERVLALLNLPRFRLVHQALNVVQSHLSLANANYHGGEEQSDTVVPPHYRKRDCYNGGNQATVDNGGWRTKLAERLRRHGRKQGTNPVLQGERGLIAALEWLSSCLTVLNDIVEGGVSGRAHIMTGAIQIINGKLESIGHEPLRGHQSLKDFVERTFLRPARVIERTGERYRMLRHRITENAELVNAKLQALQRDKQTLLLEAAEVFVAIGGAYYLSQFITHGVPDPLLAWTGKWIRNPLVFPPMPDVGAIWLAHTPIYAFCGAVAIGLWLNFRRKRTNIDPSERTSIARRQR